jgi:hypothetical protein
MSPTAQFAPPFAHVLAEEVATAPPEDPPVEGVAVVLVVGVGVVLVVGVGVVLVVGVGVVLVVGVGVVLVVGVGVVLVVGVPLFHTSFFFDFMHVYLLPFAIDIFPAFVQAAPGLTEACAAGRELDKSKEASTEATKTRSVMN